MDAWTCPECNRLFARQRQAHDCAPGLTLDIYFATGPDHERPIWDVVIAHLETLGPVHADVVSVGIFLKNPRKFADFRARDRWVALGFNLRRRARHPTITRKVVANGAQFWHVANIRHPDDYDGALQALLAEAYDEA